MRISDDRYDRERSSLDLALQFLRHEARTQTIRLWTGLSDDRIRNLYRSYMSRGGSSRATPGNRHTRSRTSCAHIGSNGRVLSSPAC